MALNSAMRFTKIIQSERQQLILEYALNRLIISPLAPYIDAVYLYGSCARGSEHWDSDVDLLVQFNRSLRDHPELKREMRLLKSQVTTDNIYDPETDLKIVVGNDWRHSNMPFFENVRKEGLLIWP